MARHAKEGTSCNATSQAARRRRALLRNAWQRAAAVPGARPGRRRPLLGRPCRGACREIHRGRARSSRHGAQHPVEDRLLGRADGRRRAAADRRAGLCAVHWCGHSTGGAMGQVLAIEHPGAHRPAGAERDLGQDRRLLPPPVRGARADAAGAGAGGLSESRARSRSTCRPGCATTMPTLPAAEAKANETIPIPEIVLSRIAAIVAHDRREQLQKVRAPDAGDLRPRRHGDAALFHRGAGAADPRRAGLRPARRRPFLSERAWRGVSACNDRPSCWSPEMP